MICHNVCIITNLHLLEDSSIKSVVRLKVLYTTSVRRTGLIINFVRSGPKFKWNNTH